MLSECSSSTLCRAVLAETFPARTEIGWCCVVRFRSQRPRPTPLKPHATGSLWDVQVRKDCRVSVFLDSYASTLFIIMQENYDSRCFDEWTWLDIPHPRTQRQGRWHIPPISQNPCLPDWHPKFDGRTPKICSLHNLFDYRILGMISLCILSRSTADSFYTGIRWFIVTKISTLTTITLCVIRVHNVLILCSQVSWITTVSTGQLAGILGEKEEWWLAQNVVYVWSIFSSLPSIFVPTTSSPLTFLVHVRPRSLFQFRVPVCAHWTFAVIPFSCSRLVLFSSSSTVSMNVYIISMLINTSTVESPVP